jgi:hypothetical protein
MSVNVLYNVLILRKLEKGDLSFMQCRGYRNYYTDMNRN